MLGQSKPPATPHRRTETLAAARTHETHQASLRWHPESATSHAANLNNATTNTLRSVLSVASFRLPVQRTIKWGFPCEKQKLDDPPFAKTIFHAVLALSQTCIGGMWITTPKVPFHDEGVSYGP
eukprot:3107583-Amphidinium_carterae.2